MVGSNVKASLQDVLATGLIKLRRLLANWRQVVDMLDGNKAIMSPAKRCVSVGVKVLTPSYLYWNMPPQNGVFLFIVIQILGKT